MTTSYDAPSRRDTQYRDRRRTLAIAELFASVTAVIAIAAVFVTFVGAHLTFFGDPVVIHAEDVRNYWICVSFVVFGVVASFATAVLRGAVKSYVWHGVVAVIGLFVSVIFSVTETGTPSDPRPEHAPRDAPLGHACHSGGDNSECIGG